MNVQENVYRVRAVIFFDRGWWIAQCLEYNLCTSSKRREDLPRNLMGQLRTQTAADIFHGKRPFETLSTAPKRFWRLYEEGGEPMQVEPRVDWLDRLLMRFRRAPRLLAEIVTVPA